MALGVSVQDAGIFAAYIALPMLVGAALVNFAVDRKHEP
jgi:hypothetical protein